VLSLIPFLIAPLYCQVNLENGHGGKTLSTTCMKNIFTPTPHNFYSLAEYKTASSKLGVLAHVFNPSNSGN
jgi:hypothetical protein